MHCSRFSYEGPYQIVKFAGTDQSQRALTGNRVIVRTLYPKRKLARTLAHREKRERENYLNYIVATLSLSSSSFYLSLLHSIPLYFRLLFLILSSNVSNEAMIKGHTHTLRSLFSTFFSNKTLCTNLDDRTNNLKGLKEI